MCKCILYKIQTVRNETNWTTKENKQVMPSITIAYFSIVALYVYWLCDMHIIKQIQRLTYLETFQIISKEYTFKKIGCPAYHCIWSYVNAWADTAWCIGQAENLLTSVLLHAPAFSLVVPLAECMEGI